MPMLLLFPFIYILSFIGSLLYLIKKKADGFLWFIILGLPIYSTTLSILYIKSFKYLITPFQIGKELLALLALGIVLFHFNRKIKWQLLDRFILGFILLSVIYLLLPVGSFGFTDKIIAVKSMVFYFVLYFTGRFFDLKQIRLNKYFSFICLTAILAALVAVGEVISNTHLQSITGYAEFNSFYYNAEPEGNYGLSWTFERTDGLKRFAAFFANPLEHSASTLVVIALLAGMYTNQKNKLKLDTFGIITLVATLFSVLFSVSRAPFISYILLIYAYAWITGNIFIRHSIHALILLGAIYLLVIINKKGMAEFIMDTINLNDTSTLGHISEWVTGFTAMMQKPFGLGLGESGRVANSLGSNTGGENQFIIIGVQLGFPGLFLYLATYITSITAAIKGLKILNGRERKLSMSVLLMKISFIVPLLTSYFESYTYISYISWFLTGLMINMLDRKMQNKTITHVPAH